MPSPKRCILCVEDRETCELIDFLLSYSEYDYVLRTAITAAEGLLLAQSEQFDLCLLDLRLPDGSGLELCRQIRSLHPHTPILFYSRIAHEAYRQEALNAGAQEYLVKPQSMSALIEVIARLFRQAKSAGTGM